MVVMLLTRSLDEIVCETVQLGSLRGVELLRPWVERGKNIRRSGMVGIRNGGHDGVATTVAGHGQVVRITAVAVEGCVVGHPVCRGTDVPVGHRITRTIQL